MRRPSLPGRRFGALGAAAVLVLGATVATSPADPATAAGGVAKRALPPTAADVDPCLDRAEVLILDGPQTRFPDAGRSTTSGAAVDARTATWSVPAGQRGTEKYPLSFEDASGDVCFVGGTVRHELGHDDTTWDAWHDVGGAVTVKVPGFTLAGTRIDNVGDGVAIGTRAAEDWTLRDVLVRGAHDDCVQNDDMASGRIERSFFDGCYVFYSARGAPGSGRDGGEGSVVIRDSLVRMKAMPHVFRPDTYAQPGHGPIFKLSNDPSTGRSPVLSVHDTVFRVNQDASMGGLGLPTYDHDRDPATPGLTYLGDCSGNVVVWTGEGPYPAPLPDCFTVTTDVGVWDEAVARWREATGLADAGR